MCETGSKLYIIACATSVSFRVQIVKKIQVEVLLVKKFHYEILCVDVQIELLFVANIEVYMLYFDFDVVKFEIYYSLAARGRYTYHNEGQFHFGLILFL